MILKSHLKKKKKTVRKRTKENTYYSLALKEY